MESSRQIEECAATWLLRRDSGQWTAEAETQLKEWLEAATLHRVAFLRLEAGWDEANRLKALGAGLAPRRVPGARELLGSSAMNPAARRLSREDSRKFWSAAAAILVIAAGVVFYAAPWGSDRYTTPVGGVASVPLKDGSNVTLNTGSQIRVQITEHERRVDLAHGEAFFEVAKDAVRPFVVYAGARRIVAVGTKFSVRREDDGVQVVVTEGMVRFQEAGSIPGLSAGTVAHAADAGITVDKRSVGEAEDILSWRSGYVVFHETALGDAVTEFNRYNQRKIVIEDKSVAAIRLTGKFRSTNYEIFVRLLEDSFKIKARHTRDRIVLASQ